MAVSGCDNTLSCSTLLLPQQDKCPAAHSTASQQASKATGARAQDEWGPLPSTSFCLWMQPSTALEYVENRLIWSGRRSPDSCAKQMDEITGWGQPDLEPGPEASSEGCARGG